LRRALRLPLAILAILLFGIVGVVLLRVAADGKPHSVTLTWTPPPARPGSVVAGYNIYRCCRPDGTFATIASGVVTPTWVDHDLIRGNTYRYFVRTVDTTGRESWPSEQVVVVIP